MTRAMMDRPPNIRHFAALAATVRHGSLSRAARAVNLSQPALTQAITGLEASLGTTLFERGPQGMTPTEAALLLAPRAEAAIEHIGSSRVTGTQLRAFLAVVRAGSYSAAAEATGISAASLHRAVADLSVALGQRLIDRRGRTLVLTPAGERRARGFGLATAELRAGLAEVAALQGKAGGRIAVGQDAAVLVRANERQGGRTQIVVRRQVHDVRLVADAIAAVRHRRIIARGQRRAGPDGGVGCERTATERGRHEDAGDAENLGIDALRRVPGADDLLV